MRDRIAVVGGNGFIGHAITQNAQNAGAFAVPLVRRSLELPHEIVWKDASDVTSSLNRNGIACLVIAAGRASVSDSVIDPRGDFFAGVDLVSKLLEAARAAEVVPHVILLSSAAVYGQPTAIPVTEGADLRPISPYGHHKAIAEYLCGMYAVQFGIPVTVLRVFSVIGPRQRKLLPYELWAQAVGVGDQIVLRGTGDESRDYLHVDDLAAAVLGVAALPTEGGTLATINTASGVETSVGEIARYYRDELSPNKTLVFQRQVSSSDPIRWCADTRRLRDLLPTWQARPLSDALADCASAWSVHRP